MLSLVEVIDTQTCRICKLEKPKTEFYKNGWHPKKFGKSLLRYECKVCCNLRSREYARENRDRIGEKRRKAYQDNKRPAISHNLKRYYGITMEDYDRLFDEQRGRCKICGIHQIEFERRFDVDHNHRTGNIRGLLCIRCNRGVGLLKDSISVLESALRYLREDQELGDKKPLG